MAEPPRWLQDLSEPDQARVVELLIKINELTDQVRQPGDVVHLDITLWNEQDRGSAVGALRALAVHGRETLTVLDELADCYDQLARTIGGVEPTWHEKPEEPTGGEG